MKSKESHLRTIHILMGLQETTIEQKRNSLVKVMENNISNPKRTFCILPHTMNSLINSKKRH